jgi:alkylhydroperoxidase family enzyme
MPEEKRMAWIKTVSMDEDPRVKKAAEAQRSLYPIEYATPVHPEDGGQSASIVASHSLIPEALYHAFSTFGALMSSELPLKRRQHEMIATVVSVTNRCVY